jgi:hypothetical protein
MIKQKFIELINKNHEWMLKIGATNKMADEITKKWMDAVEKVKGEK